MLPLVIALKWVQGLRQGHGTPQYSDGTLYEVGGARCRAKVGYMIIVAVLSVDQLHCCMKMCMLHAHTHTHTNTRGTHVGNLGVSTGFSYRLWACVEGLCMEGRVCPKRFPWASPLFQ